MFCCILLLAPQAAFAKFEDNFQSTLGLLEAQRALQSLLEVVPTGSWTSYRAEHHVAQLLSVVHSLAFPQDLQGLTGILPRKTPTLRNPQWQTLLESFAQYTLFQLSRRDPNNVFLVTAHFLEKT